MRYQQEDHMAFPLTITENQFHKLRKGKTVQLTHSQISLKKKHNHQIFVQPPKFKRLHTAARNGKGVRLQLTPNELEMSGAGFMDFINKLKNAGKWVKDKIIDSDVYQKNLKPVVSDIVRAGVNVAKPFVPQPAQGLFEQGVKKVGEATNAYGMGMHAIRNGYGRNSYGYGSNQSDVALSAKAIKGVIPASEFVPLVAPSKMASLYQPSQAVKGSGRGRPRKMLANGFKLN